jgi:hypothetical protein
MMNVADDLAFFHLRTEIERDLKDAGLGREDVVFAIRGLRDDRGCFARLFTTFERTDMDEHVLQSTLRDAMHAGGNAFATAEFGGDDELALILGFDGQAGPFPRCRHR